MTLVITEVSKFGIAMVADSAVTFTEVLPSGDKTHHVLNGARKLQVIPFINAGISVWGLGSVPTSNGQLSTDSWLEYFISQHSAIRTIGEFAKTLTQDLQKVVGNKKQPMGFHLAGYTEVGNCSLPTFYHIRNVDGNYKHYEHHEFVAGHDYPPQEISENQVYVTRNGDYGPYAALAEAVQMALPHIQIGMGIAMPYPSLDGRVAYHTAWVRFVSELYASSELLRTIGGNISALGIYPSGQMLYLPTS